MQFEVIRKSHKKEVVVGTVVFILIAIILIVHQSFAKYQTTKNMTIVEGTINYKVPDFKIMGIYYQKEGSSCTEDNCYEEKETMPESGYEINTTKSYCELNGSKDNNAEMYTDKNGQHIISKLSKGDRCYLYFDNTSTVGGAGEEILGDIIAPDSKDSFTGVATGNEGIFKSKDDDGDTYYFRGSVENNYVKFANKYWRIIRINGDGTIRLIYQGESATSTGTDAQVTLNFDETNMNTFQFNSSGADNMYVGFKYAKGEVHGTEEASIALNVLDVWYTINLKDYEDKIDSNAGFCNDRDPYTDESGITSGGGTGTTSTRYGAYIRLRSNYEVSAAPTFKCKYSSDLFTKSGAVKKDGTANGNRSLTNPIGLITTDEVVYAGGYYGLLNKSYYLYTGQDYWTMSPYWYIVSSGCAHVFYVRLNGDLDLNNVDGRSGVRPVINLKADTKFTYKNATTKGTMNDPYVVE